MKLVLMSDTHLRSLTEEFVQICDHYCSDADLVIHLGDWTRKEVLDHLETFPLEAVAGNMDGPEISQRLPRKKILDVGGVRLGLAHGWGSYSDLPWRLFKEFSQVDAILFGHTHQPLVEKKNGVLFFNPGSLFHGRSIRSRTLGILHLEDCVRTQIVNI